MSLEDIRNDRIKKLNLLKEKGIDSYPAESYRTTTIKALLDVFESAQDKESVTVAGRVMSIREHGGTMFADINDGTGKIQGYFKIDVTPEEAYRFFVAVVDVGDFIEISGTPARTQRGEKSILVSGWRMLTKSLRTIPEQWVGL